MSDRPLRDWLNNWFKPKKPDPAPTPVEPDPTPGPTIPTEGKMRLLTLLWKLWNQRVELKKLWPALVSVPVLFFFVISGLVAWAALLLGFFWKIVQQVVTLCC